uniref:Uncharacterized protein n=1 Tax=Peronospora matthiolae TaxID=2874970 RepID=A0AAV1TH20_9STRA
MRLAKKGLLEHLDAMKAPEEGDASVNLESQRHEGLRDCVHNDQHKSSVNGAHGRDNGKSMGHTEAFFCGKVCTIVCSCGGNYRVQLAKEELMVTPEFDECA